MDLSRMHPQARVALDVQDRVPLTVENLDEARLSMVRAAPDEVGPGPGVRRVVEVDAGGVPARLYDDRPGGSPVLVYAHGGGWVMGDLRTHDGFCRQLAADAGWAVLAVDYRRAPECPYPAAIDDVEQVLAWVRGAGAAALDVDAGRVAVGGDSAGGQLAAVLARRARDSGRPVAAQVLICPVVDPAMDYPADLEDYGLDRAEMRFFWDAYTPPGVDRSNPDLDPFRADPTGLPPTVMIMAELDILRPEAERYAAALLRADVPVTAVRYQGLNHDFARKLAIFDAAHAAVAQIASALSTV